MLKRMVKRGEAYGVKMIYKELIQKNHIRSEKSSDLKQKEATEAKAVAVQLPFRSWKA